jgi:hypothetical protein
MDRGKSVDGPRETSLMGKKKDGFSATGDLADGQGELDPGG